jgi:propionyl-CoA synthetase
MEEVLAGHGDVAECAVFGVGDELKGEVPLGLVVLNTTCTRAAADIVRECAALIREKIGPVAAFKNAAIVRRLPKTRSGKVLRGVMRKIANGEAWTMPATIDDPSILAEIEGALRSVGYPRVVE